MCLNKNKDEETSNPCNFAEGLAETEENCSQSNSGSGCIFLKSGTRKPSEDLLKCCEPKDHCKCGSDPSYPFIGDIYSTKSDENCVYPGFMRSISMYFNDEIYRFLDNIPSCSGTATTPVNGETNCEILFGKLDTKTEESCTEIAGCSYNSNDYTDDNIILWEDSLLSIDPDNLKGVPCDKHGILGDKYCVIDKTKANSDKCHDIIHEITDDSFDLREYFGHNLLGELLYQVYEDTALVTALRLGESMFEEPTCSPVNDDNDQEICNSGVDSEDTCNLINNNLLCEVQGQTCSAKDSSNDTIQDYCSNLDSTTCVDETTSLCQYNSPDQDNQGST